MEIQSSKILLKWWKPVVGEVSGDRKSTVRLRKETVRLGVNVKAAFL